MAGLTKRDIQLVVDAGYNTVESVAYTFVASDLGKWNVITCADVAGRPKRVLEQVKGISEQKATKLLAEGTGTPTSFLRILVVDGH